MNKILSYIQSSIGFQSLIVWLAIFLISFIHPLWTSPVFALLNALLSVISMMIVYYVTQAVLIPRLLIKEKRAMYIILSVVMVALLVYVCASLEMYLFRYYNVAPKHELQIAFTISRFVVVFTITYALSNVIYLSGKTSEDARQKEELLSEKKMLEVKVLKSQINSHFIFNALNNIYSMTYFKDEYTSGYVLKLARMMRYVMEDCDTELTPLVKDIEYIENFIDFQKLRFENDKDIIFTYHVDDNGSILVPPMIFQPLVENCFKHTPLDVDRNSYIHISLDANEKEIHFMAENSQPLIKSKSNPKDGGIGIENTKRRLSLYYGDNYTLDISDNTDCFRVKLSIYL